MAFKIARYPNKIAVIGAPTSAAALQAGHERAPAALRAAGLIAQLEQAGYEVTDLGDCATQVFQPDDEHPRARNVSGVLAALNELRPRVEQAVKSGALPLVLGGDCSIALATLAGLRRYFRSLSLVWMDRDADLNIPATTPSGCLDGMVVSHIVGRGAAELVRFWSELPLVREPDVVLFGTDRLDPPEEEFLSRSPIRHYPAADVLRQGAAVATQAALERVHATSREFLLHLDVDVISADDFRATNYAATGGLRLVDVRAALGVFARRKTLAALEVTVYNPELDPDGSAAQLLVELLVGALAERLEALAAAEAAAPAPRVVKLEPAEVKEALEEKEAEPAVAAEAVSEAAAEPPAPPGELAPAPIPSEPAQLAVEPAVTIPAEEATPPPEGEAVEATPVEPAEAVASESAVHGPPEADSRQAETTQPEAPGEAPETPKPPSE